MMKGLLLKDFYLTIKYCRMFLFMIVIFAIIPLAGAESMFYIFYPCVITSMLPMMLCAYDERDKWNVYSQTLPVTKAQYVSSKYIAGLILSGCTIVLNAIVQAVRIILKGAPLVGNITAMVATLITVSLLAPSIVMPIIFKFGVEKGRIAYYFVIGAICAVGALFFMDYAHFLAKIIYDMYFVCALSAGIYALSWMLSVYLYNKREI